MIIYYGKLTEGIFDRACTEAFGRKREIYRSRHGKPLFSEGGGYLSITHTRELWMCAFEKADIGLDCEYLDRKIPDPDRLAGRFFAHEEAEYIGGLEGDRKMKELIRLWTRKEAWSKLTGLGLSGGLDGAVFVNDGRITDVYEGIVTAELPIREIPGLCCSVAYREAELPAGPEHIEIRNLR